MNMPLNGFAKRIVDDGLASAADVARAQLQANRENKPLITYLVEHHVVDGRKAAFAASREFGIPLLDLASFEINEEVIQLVDEKLIVQFNALPLYKRDKRLFIAIDDPGNIQALDQIQFQSGLHTEPVLVEASQLERAIDTALEKQTTAIAALSDTDLDELEFDGLNEAIKASTDIEIDDAPLVRYVNKLLLDAINKGASDIHFEPYDNIYRVRFRLDGILEEMSAPPINLAGRIAARIKVMARMDISERRIPQDGRIKLNLSHNRSIDFRVSTCPTLFGEKVVLRILDSVNVKFGIDALGFTPPQKKLFLDAINKPYGMVLVTGPTGSGKTVSLYTALHILNTSDRNISTVEDPAEIYLSGVNQVNINPKVGLTFASALRAFLRQDPDIIMVGEIRDQETAEIALKAAQTGHMVLSTLHTNDAPQSITRLLNIGIEPYNIVSALSLVIAQRLVRRLCNHCKQPVELSDEALLAEGFQPEQLGTFTPYVASGCQYCNNGYKNRVGIFQVMPISDEMSHIIMSSGNSMDLAAQAKVEGILDIRASGLLHVMKGITSLDEVNRVTME